MNTTYDVGGLPAHPLLVHAVVVLLPLAALCTILHSLWPAARARLGIVPTLLAAVGTALVPVTVAAGHALADQLGGTAGNPLLRRHEHLAEQILPWSIALTVVALGNWLWRRYGEGLAPRWLRLVIPVVTVVVSLGVMVAVIRAGDAGARATWQ
ncbi:hypothetical protein GCM10011492_00690 [Flexivirga endophytica]|uniref:DUF2231 domain-containing protein n=1 Tax=Flexivirga endophytica TaxID=1849103 RepID=A0A916SRR9_9MICO|nr:DUF2231 domain-containing protein [Flexivirga endophytica]GGB14872.1 hypothetical protein GCM10011492_00690 [Flexivirga endophytica]GHB65371.1 hypothetical protein GCM10008112_37800 [Flexivirga endophytica]